MKLYNSNLSPFTARIRMMLYAKNIAFEAITPPADGSFRDLTPFGKVPLLIDGENTIPESDTIAEYIEETHPTTPLLPKDAGARTHVRLLSRIADLYLLGPLQILFAQVAAPERSADLTKFGIDELEKGLAYADHYVGASGFAYGDGLTLADCALVPALFFVGPVGGALGKPDWLKTAPKVSAYYSGVLVEPIVARVHGELAEAMKAYQER